MNLTNTIKIIDYILSIAELKNDCLEAGLSKEAFMEGSKLSLPTINKYIGYLCDLDLIDLRENTITITFENALRIILLLDIRHKKLEMLIRKSALLYSFMGENLSYEHIKGIITEKWQCLDSLYVLAYIIYRHVSQSGIILRDLGGEKQVPIDYVVFEDRLRELIIDLCRYYEGKIAFPKYIIVLPRSKGSIKQIILRVLKDTPIKQLQFEDTLLKGKKIVEIDVEETKRKLDKNIFIIIYKALETKKGYQKRKEPEYIRKMIRTIKNLNSIFVALAISLSEEIK